MIDRLELRVPKEIPLRKSFLAKHKSLRAPEGTAYRNVINAPELSLRVFESCIRHPVDSPKQHYKVNFRDVHRLSTRDLIGGIKTVFEIDDEDARYLRVMRVDLTVDVRNVCVRWFFETSRVKYKRAASSYGRWEQSNVLKHNGRKHSGVQTLVHGTWPDRYVIYDKVAELEAEIRRRTHIREELVMCCGAPMYKSRVPKDLLPYTTRPILTRVERQVSDRSVPVELQTLGQLIDNAAGLKDPFKHLVLTAGSGVVPNESRWKGHKWLMAWGLAGVVKRYGRVAVRKRLHNPNRVFDRYGDLLSAQAVGITKEELRRLYLASTSMQLNRPGPDEAPFQGAQWVTASGGWVGDL